MPWRADSWSSRRRDPLAVQYDSTKAQYTSFFPFDFFVAWSDKHAANCNEKIAFVKKTFLHYIAFWKK